MGVEYVVVLKPLEPPPVEVSDEDVEQYYAEHCPAGSPPLADIREHIVHAIRAAATTPVRDPLQSMTASVSGRTTARLALDIDQLAEIHGWPRLHDFVVRHEQKYFSAAEGLALFEPLVDRLEAEIRGEVSTRKPPGQGVWLPVKKHMSTWEGALEELIPYRDLLRAAAAEGRTFRVSVFA